MGNAQSANGSILFIPDWATEYPDNFFDRHWFTFPDNPPGPAVLYSFGIFIAIVGFLSVIGNGLVVFTILKSPTLRRQKMFMANLSFSDFLSPALTYHLFVASCIGGRWLFPVWVCNAYAFIQGFSGLMSICSLAMIAVERYLSITRPYATFSEMSVRKRAAIIIAMWGYCFLICCPPLFGVSRYVPAGFLVTCCFDFIQRDPVTRLFIFYLFIFGLGLPIVLIFYCYISIFLMIRQQTQFEKERDKQQIEGEAMRYRVINSESTSGLPLPNMFVLQTFNPNLLGAEPRSSEECTRAGSSMSLRPRSEVGITSARSSLGEMADHVKRWVDKKVSAKRMFMIKVKGKDKRAAFLAFALILVFLVAWIPYGILTMTGQFGPLSMVTPWFAMIPSMLAKSSTLYNPFIYAWKDARFQRALRRYVCSCFGDQAADETSKSATTKPAPRASIPRLEINDTNSSQN